MDVFENEILTDTIKDMKMELPGIKTDLENRII